MNLTLNQIQDQAKKLLSDNKIHETLELLHKFINSGQIKDKEFSESLILNSGKFKEICRAHNEGRSTYEEFMLQRNKIIISLLQLVDDILIITKNKPITTISESTAVMTLENYQDEHLRMIREQMLHLDKVIVVLVEQIKEREKQILELRDQSKIQELNEKIEDLKKQLKYKEEEYNKLNIEYQRLKNENISMYEIKQEIAYLRDQIEEKNKIQKTLEDYFNNRLKEIKERDDVIKHLRDNISELEGVIKAKVNQIHLLNNDIVQLEKKNKGCLPAGIFIVLLLLITASLRNILVN